jgi:Ulp1 family protease
MGGDDGMGGDDCKGGDDGTAASEEILKSDEYITMLEAQYDKYCENGSQEDHVDANVIIPNVSESRDYTLNQSFQSRTSTISKEWIDKVNRALAIDEDDRLLFEKFGIPMTSGKLKCLRNGVWLNDEVINMYCLLLKDRDSARCEVHKNRLQSWFFSTCFMDKLLNSQDKHKPGYCYDNVKR